MARWRLRHANRAARTRRGISRAGGAAAAWRLRGWMVHGDIRRMAAGMLSISRQLAQRKKKKSGRKKNVGVANDGERSGVGVKR
jgi:hypothetical protein